MKASSTATSGAAAASGIASGPSGSQIPSAMIASVIAISGAAALGGTLALHCHAACSFAVGDSIVLGRVAGIRIGVNWSWLVAVALITWTLAAGVFPDQDPGLGKPTYIVMGVVAIRRRQFTDHARLMLAMAAAILVLACAGQALRTARDLARIDPPRQ